MWRHPICSAVSGAKVGGLVVEAVANAALAASVAKRRNDSGCSAEYNWACGPEAQET